ncbi:hypothetical protein HK101_005963 [Irineochytrium annulatum]|nr:hypothetical protein HK101_005963 [Irineochytrium annulatum]
MLFRSVVGLAGLIASAAALTPLSGHLGGHTINGAYLFQVAGDVADPTNHVVSGLTSAGVAASDITVRTVISTNLFNGVSVSIPAGTSNADTDTLVQSIPGVTRIFRVNKRYVPTPQSVSVGTLPPEAIHSLTGVNEARKKYGVDGTGINVAVIDTGVYYLHPALGGGFGPGFKVSKGYDLVGDNYGVANQTLQPDDDPIDNCSTESHGTHVAGIVAGDASNITATGFIPAVPWTGVAPNANIFAYKVFGCPADSTGTDVMAAAIYRAHNDGADLINLSIGGGPAYPDEADSFAAQEVGTQGSYVLGANGNDGASGIMTNGAPGNSIGGFGVASFDNVAVPTMYLSVDDAKFPYSVGQTNGAFQFDTPYEIVVNNLDADANDVQDDGCTGAPTVDAKGKAMLIRWGSTAFGGSVKRCTYALNAGAVACIIYSNTAAIPGIIGGSEPSLATTRTAGQAIIAAIKAGKKPVFVVTQKSDVFPLPTAGTVSDFSSPGLTPLLNVKPDFGGIGGQVYSTVSVFAASAGSLKVPYAIYSGTSMATPYSAGAAALILQAKKKAVDFLTLKALIQNNAVYRNQFGQDFTDSIVNQGAGLINVYNAISATTIITPSVLELNDTKHASQHYELTIKNTNTSPITYTVGHHGAAMVTPFIAGDDSIQVQTSTSYTPDYATVTFSKGNTQVSSLDVTVAAGASATVHIHFAGPASAIPGLFPIYSGYITFALAGQPSEPIATVPYAGMVGDWNSAPVWSRKSAAFDDFTTSQLQSEAANATSAAGLYDGSGSFVPLQTGAVINATEGAYILTTTSVTSRRAFVDVIFAGSDKSILPPNVRHTTSLGYVSALQLTVATNTISGPFPLTFIPLQRNAPAAGQGIQAPGVFVWTGTVTPNATIDTNDVQLPAGQYQMRFAALKQFGRNTATAGLKSDENYDVVMSPVFNLAY